MPAPSAPRPGLGVRLMGPGRPLGAVVGVGWIALGLWGSSTGRLGPSIAMLVGGTVMLGWHGYRLVRARRAAPAPAAPPAPVAPPAD